METKKRIKTVLCLIATKRSGAFNEPEYLINNSWIPTSKLHLYNLK